MVGAVNLPEALQHGTTASAAAAERRREIITDLKAGALDFATLLLVAEVDPPVAQMRAHKALRHLPGWNTRTIDTVMAEHNIPQTARVGWFLTGRGARITETFTQTINLGPGGRPPLPPQWPMFGRCDWLERTP